MAKTPMYKLRPSTAVIYSGFDPKLSVGSARPAVFRSSTYVFSSPEAAERAFSIALGKIDPEEGEVPDLIYARLSHPNAEIVESQIVYLEPTAKTAAVFNSGMAAISTIFLTYCPPKTKFIYTAPLYGGTYHLVEHMLRDLGIEGIPIPAGDTELLLKTIRETQELKMIYIESPANPTLLFSDISGAVREAKAHKDKPLVCVDNTMMGPVFQHPLKLGADISVYSATKYLAGFSDMLGGVALMKDIHLMDQLRATRVILGNILPPDECWILDSRLPTVELRMNKQSKSAQRIAERLGEHPKIEKLIYPSVFTDPEQIRIREEQTLFPGAMISFLVKGGKKAAFDFLRNLNLVKNAVSLGGMESLCSHPASTTHSEMTQEFKDQYGVADNLVRISVGIEDWHDLLQDFNQALDSLD